MSREQEILQQLKARKRSFEIDGESHWVVEGDLVLNEFRLRQYAARQAAKEQAPEPMQRGLVAMTHGDKVVRWAAGEVLSYAVRRSLFRDQTAYDQAVAGMARACADWQAVCGVQFAHRAELDQQPDGPAVVFQVRQVAGGRGTIASAFFPDWSEEERWVNLYDAYFDPNLGFDATGVLRHELGHVLGFRHEHIRDQAPMDCPDEPMADTRALTEYDAESVMHYFCGGMGSATLAITELDRQGAEAVYGPPYSRFH